MALEQLVNGMTGQQLANTIKNNFDKVLDVESAENKAENAGKALKTDYDATRYVEMELADGTPIRMRWDVFCQAIASVVAGNLPYFRRNAIENGDFNTFTFDGCYLFGAPSENFSNRPIASSMEGMLIVINSFQTHIVQIYIDIQGCVYHFRTCYGGSWRNWVKIN